MSTVLLGQRRMGKTEIFLRVVNRLFWEQDYQDPKAAVPVYFNFPDEIVSQQDFALKYTENFVRWYAAFRLQDPLLLREPKDPAELIPMLRENTALSEPFRRFALGLLKAIPSGFLRGRDPGTHGTGTGRTLRWQSLLHHSSHPSGRETRQTAQ
jgi:hypothetical protein